MFNKRLFRLKNQDIILLVLESDERLQDLLWVADVTRAQTLGKAKLECYNQKLSVETFLIENALQIASWDVIAPSITYGIFESIVVDQVTDAFLRAKTPDYRKIDCFHEVFNFQESILGGLDYDSERSNRNVVQFINGGDTHRVH